MGGDFNLVQDTILDRSLLKQTNLTKSAATLKFHADQLGLADPWRTRFPSKKEFSFFSHVHHSFSRIDFFLLDNKLLQNTVACDYHSIVISDHAPTSVDITFSPCRPPHKSWKFNSQLLSEAKFKDFLTKQINFFFEINDIPDISSDILWNSPD